MAALFEKAGLEVANPGAFATVRGAIESAFSDPRVSTFLSSLQTAKLRIRHFEDVLQAGKLGKAAEQEYGRLGDGDQGMIREFYLSTLEAVDPALRGKFLKVYAYY